MIQLRTNFRKWMKWFIALFIVLFIFRLIYGYVAADRHYKDDNAGDFFSGIGNLRRNYASEKFAMKADAQASMTSNQKFEKTASVTAKSSNFEKDEKLIRTKARSYNAVVQYEQSLGQKGYRQIHLLIGVPPVLFDSFFADIQKISLARSIIVTKVDKTNEYRQLNAKKNSIENTLRSLNELKSKGGQISDYITLNEKILEIEEKLQELGVELGNFDTENEFCTVKLSLYEETKEKDISFIHRTKIAIEWTIKYFAFLALTSAALGLMVFALSSVTNKQKIINQPASKSSEQAKP